VKAVTHHLGNDYLNYDYSNLLYFTPYIYLSIKRMIEFAI